MFWEKLKHAYQCHEYFMNRYRSRLFDQVGHQTIENGHFLTKSCHRQTYQNYEQSRQKLGTFLQTF